MTEEIKTKEVKGHETSTFMVKAAPAELDAGNDIVLKVRVLCPSACDLQGEIVKIMAQDTVVVKEIELSDFDGAANETNEFVVKAPTEPGAHTWTAVFPAQEKGGVLLHEESFAPFSFIIKPHATSITVWDIPSPIVFNTKFKLKVGVRCSAECKLTGKEIEIYDHEGVKVATGTLSDVPWLNTTVLYWSEVELEAPGTKGYYKWQAKFPKPDLELPHKGASCTFGFGTAKPADHMVTVEVIYKYTNTPLKNAEVVLQSFDGYPYRVCTDEDGLARVSVPKGEYELYVSSYDKEPFQTTINVVSDLTTKAELMVAGQSW